MRNAPLAIRSSSKPLLLEHRHFAISCSIHFLRSIARSYSHPLDLVLVAEIFRRLNDKDTFDLTLLQIEQIISTLPEITDSGMQIRDCLLYCGYCYAASRASQSNYEIENITLKIANFATERDYFQDSLLAASIALIDDLVQAGQKAKKYLSNHLDEWLKANYIDGVVHACIASDELVQQHVYDYLSTYNWANSEVSTRCWSLLALKKLQSRGFPTNDLMVQIAHDLINGLEKSVVVENTLGHQVKFETKKLSVFEVALSTLVLIACGFDNVFGVLGEQRESLEQLMRLQEKLVKGGRVISRAQMSLFTLLFFGFWAIVMVELIKLSGVATLYQGLFGILLSAFMVSIGSYLVWGQLPLTRIAPIFFGETKENPTMGDNNGKSD